MKKDFLRVGQIVNTHGIRGELRIYPLTDYKERFEELDYVFIEEGSEDKIVYIDQVKYKNNLVLLKLKGIETLNDAERYKGKYLLIERSSSRKLPEDTFLIADLIGMEVFSEQNEFIGTIKDVIQSAGNDIYEINSHVNPGKTMLIPAVGEFIKEVNIDKRIVIVKLIEGLI